MKPFNSSRLKVIIDVMQRALDVDKPFHMETWQDSWNGTSTTEAELHTCGMSACVGGHLAVSPEWKHHGGEVGDGGIPVYYGAVGFQAIADYLECHIQCAEMIVNPEQSEYFYKVYFEAVTPQIVVNRLNELLESGDW